MIRTGIIGNGYWGKIISSKLNIISKLQFTQNSTNYNPDEFSKADWIFIATPVKTHYSIAKDILLKGINVFIEKPFCLNLEQANELFQIAKINKVQIFIDNVFLSRSEILNFKVNSYKSIKFRWFKNGPFNDFLINDLLYHDIYILLYLFGEKDISKINVIKSETDKLQFNFIFDNIEVEIDYDRDSRLSKDKTITFENEVIHLNKTNEDPLFDIISSCLNNTADFKSNNQLNLITTKVFLEFKKHIENLNN
jgi:predicted dehydrogenase